MADIVYDGDFATATLCGPEIYSAPIPGVSTNYILSQEFCQKFTSFTRTAIGTAHPTATGFYLVEESTPEKVGGSLCKWTRVYAKAPDQHNEYGTTNYNFIGFYGLWGVNITAITGRDRFTKTVTARIQHDYFRTGSGPYTTAADIPLLTAQKYYYGTNENLPADYLADAPPFTDASNPSRTAYEALVAAESELVAQDSSLERWMGLFFVRKTLYVVAL